MSHTIAVAAQPDGANPDELTAYEAGIILGFAVSNNDCGPVTMLRKLKLFSELKRKAGNGRSFYRYLRSEVLGVKPCLETARHIASEGYAKPLDGQFWVIQITPSSETGDDPTYAIKDLIKEFGAEKGFLFSLKKAAEKCGCPESRLKFAAKNAEWFAQGDERARPDSFKIPAIYIYGATSAMTPLFFEQDLANFKEEYTPTSRDAIEEKWKMKSELEEFVGLEVPKNRNERLRQRGEIWQQADLWNKLGKLDKKTFTIVRTGRVATRYSGEWSAKKGEKRFIEESRDVEKTYRQEFFDGPKFKELWKKGTKHLEDLAKELVPFRIKAQAERVPAKLVRAKLKEAGAGPERFNRVIHAVGIELDAPAPGKPNVYIRVRTRPTQPTKHASPLAHSNFVKDLLEKRGPMLRREIYLLGLLEKDKYSDDSLSKALCQLECEHFTKPFRVELSDTKTRIFWKFFRLPDQAELSDTDARRIVMDFLKAFPAAAEPSPNTVPAPAGGAGAGPAKTDGETAATEWRVYPDLGIEVNLEKQTSAN